MKAMKKQETRKFTEKYLHDTANMRRTETDQDGMETWEGPDGKQEVFSRYDMENLTFFVSILRAQAWVKAFDLGEESGSRETSEKLAKS